MAAAAAFASARPASEPVDALHHVERFNDRLGFVALHVPDEVLRKFLIDRGELGFCLLQIVFADLPNPGSQRIFDRSRGLRFRYGYDPDARGNLGPQVRVTTCDLIVVGLDDTVVSVRTGLRRHTYRPIKPITIIGSE